MTEQGGEKSGGLLHSATVLAATLVGILQTRLTLLSADLHDDREYLLALLLATLIALFCLGVGVILATILLVLAFWEGHRLAALGVATGMFMAAALVAWRYAVHKARSKPRLFEASLAELSKDRQLLAAQK